MQGYLVLSEARSGSSWLTAMANNTGVLGNCAEWLQPSHLEKPFAEYDADSHFQMIMRESATENGRFAAKIFPAELFRVHCELGYDFVHRCRQEHEVSVVLLRRKDTLAQAISLTRALQTRQWTSTDFKHARKPDYDFHRICQSLFYIHRSYEFWSTYAMTQAMPFEIICYEDLLDDPSPFLNHLAGELGVTVSGPTETKLGIQRDALSAEWRERFQQDAGKYDILAEAHLRAIPVRTLHNARQFLRKGLTTPFPFALHFR